MPARRAEMLIESLPALGRWDKVKKVYKPRPYEMATCRRFNFDAHYDRFPLDNRGNEIMPFCVGSSVLCGRGGQPGEIASFASGVYATKVGYSSCIGGCTVSFEAEGEQVYIFLTWPGQG